MPEMADLYIGAETMLPGRNQMPRGHEVAWSHDAHGHVMGTVLTNPLLDLIKSSLLEARLQNYLQCHCRVNACPV